MTQQERHSVFSLAFLYATRMLGLFMVLPVFVLYGDGYDGVSYRTPEVNEENSFFGCVSMGQITKNCGSNRPQLYLGRCLVKEDQRAFEANVTVMETFSLPECQEEA